MIAPGWPRVSPKEPKDLQEPAGAPRRRSQRYDGTDRQCRGRLLAVLRDSGEPVSRADFDAVWPGQAQLARALDGLIADGLVDPLPDGRFALPGSVRPGSVRPGSALPGSALPGSALPGSVRPGQCGPGQVRSEGALPGSGALSQTA